MEDLKFDALARFVATPRSRRQLVQAVGAGLMAGLAGVGRAGAAACPSGVVCSAQCCPNASDVCLAGECSACPSGVVCSAQCCPAGEQCVSGQCTSCPSGVVCSGQCCAAGETCQAGQCAAAPPPPPTTTAGPTTTTAAPGPGPCGAIGAPCTTGTDCCAPNVCAEGACAAACPPGYRDCERVCYPGGCCTDADCGLACLACGSDHVCHPCAAVGQVCQDGACVPATTTTTPPPTTTTTTTAPPCGPRGAACSPAAPCCGGLACCGGTCKLPPGGTCAGAADCCSGACVGGVCACGGPGTACAQNSDCCGLNCADGKCGCLTCAQLGAACGTVATRCGPLDCGECPAGQCLICAADNTCVTSCASGQVCHAGACCTPKTCAELGKTCGSVPDGCGGTLSCGACDAGQCQTCGPANTCVSTCSAGEVCCGGKCLTCPVGQVCCGGACKLPLGAAGCRGDADCCGGLTCCGGICKLPAGGSGCRGDGDCCLPNPSGPACCAGTCCYTCQGCNQYPGGANCAGAPSNIC